jgi:Transcriptional regulatory protein, C terminal
MIKREELQKRLWPDTFVDVERNLNTAVNKIREVLGDSAHTPLFVETLPRRGYRFIAPVEELGGASGQKENPIAVPRPARSPIGVFLILAGSILILLSGAAGSPTKTGAPPVQRRFNGVSHGSPSTKACKREQPGRQMTATSLTVLIARENSTFGCSR